MLSCEDRLTFTILTIKINLLAPKSILFRRPLTYDDHPIHPNPALFALQVQRPERQQMTLEELGRPMMNYDELR